MAEEVNISNVGGEGVASEVTLARLVAVTEQMAKKAGIDPKDVNKKLNALSNATDDATKTSKKSTSSTKALGAAAGAAASGLNKLGGLAGGAVLSMFTSVARSGTEMTKAFLAGETSMTAFASQLPLVGNSLGILTGLFDNSFSAFQSVATSGAAFNNSLTDLRVAAAGARMPLEQFSSMIGANSDKLAAFGGTATQGAQQIVRLNKALGSNRNDLLNMGLNYQEINEALIDYQYLQRAGNRGIQLSQAQQAQQAEAAADYTKNLVTLGKLTGEDVKSQQEKIAAAQMDVAFQAQLGRMSAEERKKMDQLMADTMATGGQAAVDELKRQFLGMPPLTEEAALYRSQFSESVNSINQGLADVRNANVTSEQFASQSTSYMMDMINANAAAFGRLEPGITAAAAGLDGPMATLAAQLQGAGIQFTDFIDGSGNVDQVRLQAAIESAKKESDARDSTTNSVATFMETIATLRSAFETSIIGPLMDAVAPALEQLVQAIAPTDEEGNPLEDSGFANAISMVSGYINDELAPGILAFIDAFKDDPMGTINEYFKSAVGGIGDLLKDVFLGKVNDGPPSDPNRGERSGGLLAAAGDAIAEGISSWWNESSAFTKAMVIGAGVLFAGGGPLAAAMAAGAVKMMGRAVTNMRTPGATPPLRTPGATPPLRTPVPGATPPPAASAAASGSRLGRLGSFLGRGAKFIPGVGLVMAGAMGAYDAATGFNADPNAGLGESLGNAGSSVLNGLTFGLLGRSSSEIAAEAAANGEGTVDSPVTSNLTPPQLATITDPSLLENIDALNSLDTASVTSYTEAMEALVEALSNLNEELSKDNDTMFTSRADAGELLSGISASSSGSNQGTQQLNSTMQQVLELLREMRDLDVDVERNTRNIIGSNLAQGSVSNVGR